MAGYYTPTAAGIWTLWVGTASTTASATSCNTWEQWNTTTNWTTANTATNSTAVWGGWVRVAELTAEQKAQWEAAALARAEENARRQAEWEKQEEARKKAEEEANKRAEELLTSQLDAEQKEEYRRDKAFTVRCRQGRRYRIRRAWSGHVSRIDDKGKEVERFCIHPRERVPLPDNQLLAKLLLESDPDHFLKTANRHAVPAGAN